jgi:hypothetical protein
LDSAWGFVVCLLELPRLSFADAQYGNGGDQTDNASAHESHAGPDNRLGGINGLVISPLSESNKTSDQHHHTTSADNANRDGAPNLRSLHTKKLHLLQRVTVWRSRRWRDKLDASIV